ncbi:MAG: hypothetical protein ACYTXA_09065 [Nostoc sp.]
MVQTTIVQKPLLFYLNRLTASCWSVADSSLSYCEEAMSNDKSLRVYVVEVKGRSQFGYELKSDR